MSDEFHQIPLWHQQGREMRVETGLGNTSWGTISLVCAEGRGLRRQLWKREREVHCQHSHGGYEGEAETPEHLGTGFRRPTPGDAWKEESVRGKTMLAVCLLSPRDLRQSHGHVQLAGENQSLRRRKRKNYIHKLTCADVPGSQEDMRWPREEHIGRNT